MANPPDKKTETPAAGAAQEAPKEQPKWLVQVLKYVGIVSAIFKKIKNSPVVMGPVRFIGKLGLKGWLKIASCFACVGIAFLAYKTVPHWNKFWALPYKSSFKDVATSHRGIPEDEKLIRYANDLIAPQYMVQLTKIVVNLEPSPRSSKNPMMAFDLFVRADSEEAAVEIKNREKQFQDHLQRFTEGLSYDQIISEEGKQNWKTKMKKELNSILNNGRVRDLYFNNLIIKP